jgi:glutathione synthase/RimK-type ligase-like ATP-grasp enzyme
LLIDALTARGANASFARWSTSLDKFLAADAVLPLCCWDSHNDPLLFQRWLGELTGNGVCLLNSEELLLWNLNKTYLVEIQGRGARIPATELIDRVSSVEVLNRMEARGWSSAVLKPIYGENGDGLMLLDRRKSHNWSFAEWLERGALLQQFQDDITTLNETTFLFIDGRFSHAVKRHLPPGEWRANLQFGIRLARVDMTDREVEQARSFLDFAPTLPLYARVDGILRPDGLTLMELELIDPYLHLEFCDGSADLLAAAIISRIEAEERPYRAKSAVTAGR